MKSIQSLFPRASKSFLDVNSNTVSRSDTNSTPTVDLRNVRRGKLNHTESEFALMLEAQKRAGDIDRYEFEGITLRWECGVDPKGRPVIIKYTPDFVVFDNSLLDGIVTKFIEVKGRYVKGKFERAIERFRHARTYWPEFQFEMWQKTKDGWKQIL